MAQALIQRMARGSLSGGKKQCEAMHPVVAGAALSTADRQRGHKLAGVGLSGDRGEHETANRSSEMRGMDQADEGALGRAAKGPGGWAKLAWEASAGPGYCKEATAEGAPQGPRRSTCAAEESETAANARTIAA